MEMGVVIVIGLNFTMADLGDYICRFYDLQKEERDAAGKESSVIFIPFFNRTWRDGSMCRCSAKMRTGRKLSGN
jgi:hypothetical protein